MYALQPLSLGVTVFLVAGVLFLVGLFLLNSRYKRMQKELGSRAYEFLSPQLRGRSFMNGVLSDFIRYPFVGYAFLFLISCGLYSAGLSITAAMTAITAISGIIFEILFPASPAARSQLADKVLMTWERGDKGAPLPKHLSSHVADNRPAWVQGSLLLLFFASLLVLGYEVFLK